MKAPSFTKNVNLFLISGCFLISSCQALKDPKVYEETVQLAEEVIEDEISK